MNKTRLFDLTGKVAVVTGGNGGLGRGIALGLAEAGAAIAVLGRNEGKNRKVLSKLKAFGARSMAVAIDLCQVPLDTHRHQHRSQGDRKIGPYRRL